MKRQRCVWPAADAHPGLQINSMYDFTDDERSSSNGVLNDETSSSIKHASLTIATHQWCLLLRNVLANG